MELHVQPFEFELLSHPPIVHLTRTNWKYNINPRTTQRARYDFGLQTNTQTNKQTNKQTRKQTKKHYSII